MAARFVSLGDDRIDPCSGDGSPLDQVRGRREQYDSGGTEGLSAIMGRQAEVEAHNRRAFFQQHPEFRIVGEKGLRRAGGFAPYREKSAESRASHAESRVSLATAARWQNTFTLKGRSVLDRTAAIICRVASASTAPTPMEPRPPAFETAPAISGVDTPAIGAWMIGSSIPTL
jgi:hypothetical protein